MRESFGEYPKMVWGKPPKMTHNNHHIARLSTVGIPQMKNVGILLNLDRHDVFLAYPEMEMVGSLLNLTKTPFKTGTGSVRGQVPYMKTRKTCWGSEYL